MNKPMCEDVLTKAQNTLSEKNIPDATVSFSDIHISGFAEKVFWFVSGVKRKLKRRLGK